MGRDDAPATARRAMDRAGRRSLESAAPFGRHPRGPMRLSAYFLPLLRENPSEAQIVSHRLMLRAGMIRQSSAGIYSWLPLGFRVLQKVEQIVREEQDRGRRARSADADDPAGRSVARERALRGLRQGDAAHHRPARARHALRPDQRGADHRHLPQTRSRAIATCRRTSITSSGSSATRCGRASA